MKKPAQKTLEIVYEEFEPGTPLPEKEQMLVDAARDATQKAYAPYSGFSVGAAVLLSNGVVVTGNNQENAAYPSGLCAERVALFSAASQYPSVSIEALAVTAFTKGKWITSPVPPCGGCRQVFVEYQQRHKKPFPLIMAGSERTIRIRQAGWLMPLSFDAEYL